MTSRRRFVVAAMAAAFAAPWNARAQAGRVYRLGVLRPTRPFGASAAADIPQPLRDLGYIEGVNLVIESRYADGVVERLPALARELATLRLDAIMAIGAASIRAAKEATSTIPIVFFGNFDPVAAGVVASLARPRGNITGTVIAPDGTLAAKKVELLRQAVPGARRIAFMLPADPAVRPQVPEVRKATSSLGLDLVVVEVVDGAYQRAFDRIFKGARPADLPVQQPTKLRLVLNRKTADALGLALSPSLLLRADEVIE